jgi:hypothetical protein
MNIQIHINKVESYKKYVGEHDYESPDQVYDYVPPYFPRCKKSGIPVPEVRKCYNGDRLFLTPAWEWFWFNLLVLRNPGISTSVLKEYWRTALHGARAFTNKYGTDTCSSDVLKTNLSKGYMRKENVTCPGGMFFRSAGERVFKGDEWVIPIYCLDGTKNPPNPEKILDLKWLVHTGQVCHPEQIGSSTNFAPNGIFKVTNFDYMFPIPLITILGREEVIDGISCRVDYMRERRLREL